MKVIGYTEAEGPHSPIIQVRQSDFDAIISLAVAIKGERPLEPRDYDAAFALIGQIANTLEMVASRPDRRFAITVTRDIVVSVVDT